MQHVKKFRVILFVMAVALAVTACIPGADAETTPTADGAAANLTPIVSATGEVFPADWADLSMETGGVVAAVEVARGDTVAAGDVLVQLNDAGLRAAVREAEAGLAEAEANLKQTMAGPSEEDIRAAENAVAAANARTAAAASRRDALYETNEDDILAAQQQVSQAQQQLVQLQTSMSVLTSIDVSNIPPNEFNPLSGGEALAYQIELAEANLRAAALSLEDLIDGPNPDQLRLQNARIGLANAQAEAARARLAYLQAQPFEEDIQLAEARVTQAEAALDAAQAQLEQATLVAPFDGTITRIDISVGEFIAPGSVVVQIGDLTTLRVETTDLNEIDVARVTVGTPATVTFDALPSVEVSGEVVRIAPKSSLGTGVNYTVIIELAEIPGEVRWGMTAFVDIEVE